MRHHLLAAMAAVLISLAGAAEARDVPKGGLTYNEISAWLGAGGYSVESKKNDSGRAYFQTKAGEVMFEVWPYDCKEGRCASVQFIAGFDMDKPLSLTTINNWNSENRYVRGYIDDEGDPWFAYDANLSPGGTYEALDDDFDVWIGFLPEITKAIGW